jgi:hypothetical protein
MQDIVGTGIYAIPATSEQLDDAASGLSALIDAAAITIGVYDFVRVATYAWVRDCATAGGGEGTRSLCMFIDAFALDPAQGSLTECPSAAEMDLLFAAIKAALEVSGDITSVGTQTASLYFSGHYAE